MLPSETQRYHSARRDRLRFLLGGQPRPVLALVFVAVLAALTESAVLTLIAQVAAALVSHGSVLHLAIGPVHATTTVGVLLDVALALSLVRLVLMFPLSALPARIMANVQARLRQQLFASFTRAAWSTQSRDREGHLQELMTNQIWQAAGGAMAITQFLIAVFTVLILLVSALLLNALAAAFVLAAGALLFVLLKPLNEQGVRRARALSEAQMSFASGVGEATRLAEETHVFGVGAAQRHSVEELLGSASDLVYKTQLIGGLVPNVYRGLIYAFIVLGLVVLNAAHAGHVASLGAVVLLLVRAGGYGQALQGSYQLMRQAMPFVDRIQGAERRYTESTLVTGSRRLGRIEAVTFEGVSFAYQPGRPVLCDISFEVARGDAIAVVGPSGAGKSTLAQLLLRLRVPECGRYLVNGFSAVEYSSDDWHARVAYVPQTPRLLHGSVAENIRYFRRVDDTAVERAARLAQIHAEVVTWPGGYNTVIGPRADAVSGGQAQRICIARALALEPEILLLDEPTSALDPRSEGLLQESLLALKDKVTLFVIAHRMSTLEICDRVMVIEAGRLRAFDTAAEVRLRNAYYRTALELSQDVPEH